MDDSTRRSLMALEELREKREEQTRQISHIAAMETSIQNDEARKKGEPVDRGYGDNDFALKNLWQASQETTQEKTTRTAPSQNWF